VELVSHMLDQVGLKVQKHQFRSQMRLPSNNGCETSWWLIGNRWSNDGSDSVIVSIIAIVSLIVDDYVVQDDASTHDQIESVLRVRPIRIASMLNLFFSRLKVHSTSFLIDASFVEEYGHLSRTPVRRDIYHRRDSISYGAHNH
jgi:hypothetical protein